MTPETLFAITSFGAIIPMLILIFTGGFFDETGMGLLSLGSLSFVLSGIALFAGIIATGITGVIFSVIALLLLIITGFITFVGLMIAVDYSNRNKKK